MLDNEIEITLLHEDNNRHQCNYVLFAILSCIFVCVILVVIIFARAIV